MIKGNDPQKGVDLSWAREYCRGAGQDKRLYEPYNQRALQDAKEISAFLSVAEFGVPRARRGAVRVLQEAGNRQRSGAGAAAYTEKEGRQTNAAFKRGAIVVEGGGVKKLKSCPFCGGADARIERIKMDVPNPFRVRCNVCGASSGWTCGREEAAELWSKRSKRSKRRGGGSGLRRRLCFENGRYTREGD